MFKVKEVAGQLIKSGRFKEAIPLVAKELDEAIAHSLVPTSTIIGLLEDWSYILLDPSDFDEVQTLGNKFIQLAVRIPGYVEQVNREEYEKNKKASYGLS